MTFILDPVKQEKYTQHIRHNFPGGHIIAPHLYTEKWVLTGVTSIRYPHWHAEQTLTAHPHIEYIEPYREELTKTHLYLVPYVGYQILEEYNDADNLTLADFYLTIDRLEDIEQTIIKDLCSIFEKQNLNTRGLQNTPTALLRAVEYCAQKHRLGQTIPPAILQQSVDALAATYTH